MWLRCWWLDSITSLQVESLLFQMVVDGEKRLPGPGAGRRDLRDPWLDKNAVTRSSGSKYFIPFGKISGGSTHNGHKSYLNGTFRVLVFSESLRWRRLTIWILSQRSCVIKSAYFFGKGRRNPHDGSLCTALT